MKKRLLSLLLAALLLVCAFPLTATAAGRTVPITIANFQVTLNGQVIDNARVKYPLIVYNQITYFPMTYYDCRFLGLTTDWNQSTQTLKIDKTGVNEPYHAENRFGWILGGEDTAEVVDFNVVVNEKSVINTQEQYPLLVWREVTYFPMTWRFCVDEFAWQYFYSNEAGLVISSSGQPIVINPVTDPQAEFNKSLTGTEIASGKHGDNIYWSLNNAGTLTIGGKGEMKMWVGTSIQHYEKPGWKQYASQIRRVVITPGVTNVGEDAFSDCSNLTEVTLPDTVKTLDYRAFQNSGLKNITIPGSVTEIKDDSFYQCTMLETVTLNEGLTKIGRHAFYGCSELRSIAIPASVASIGTDALRGCKKLDHIPSIGRIKTGEAPVIRNSNRGAGYGKIIQFYPYGSYFYEENNQLVRVEHATAGRICVERYSFNGKLLSSRLLEGDYYFPEIGRVFIGETYNFVLSKRDGSVGPETDKTVMKVDKYNKNWEKIDEVRIDQKAINSVGVFSQSAVECTESNGKLYIYMMNVSLNNNLNSNLALCIQESNMSYSVIDTGLGGFSWDFSLLTDSDSRIVALGLLDLASHDIVLSRYGNNAATERIVVRSFGESGAAATLGNLVETSTGYLSAYLKLSDFNGLQSTKIINNVSLGYTPKNSFSEASTVNRQLTNYTGNDYNAGFPVLVPIDLEGGYIMWDIRRFDSKTKDMDTICYARYYADGTIGTIHTANGILPDWRPIYVNGKVMWYVSVNSVVTFYTLDENGVQSFPATW